MSKPPLTPQQQIARRSRRDFAYLAAGGLAGIAGWRWLRSRPDDGGLSKPIRRVLEFNERITSAALFRDRRLAPEFPASMAENIQVNGQIGLGDELEESTWRLELTPYGASAARQLTIYDIRTLPIVELTAEFKCIEGWSSIVHWSGARFSDFVRHYAPGSESARYAALATPDGEYYVGIDMPSAVHPQTLLCYAMNGQPLGDEHGAPLRLVSTVKYGHKSIKRIGNINFSDRAPGDYWAEREYDYYAGL